MTTTTRTAEDRFHAACTTIAAKGHTFRHNIPSCCPGCTTAKVAGMDAEQFENGTFLWHLDRGGEERLHWIGGKAVTIETTDPESLPCTCGDLDEEYDCEACTSVEDTITRPMGALFIGHQGPEQIAAATAAKEAFEAEGFTVTWDGSPQRKVEVDLASVY